LELIDAEILNFDHVFTFQLEYFSTVKRRSNTSKLINSVLIVPK